MHDNHLELKYRHFLQTQTFLAFSLGASAWLVFLFSMLASKDINTDWPMLYMGSIQMAIVVNNRWSLGIIRSRRLKQAVV